MGHFIRIELNLIVLYLSVADNYSHVCHETDHCIFSVNQMA
jgi:hypothetical protein